MSYALKAAEDLAKEGIEAEVIDLRTIRPMDTETVIEIVKKTEPLVTVEEGWPQSGVGAEIATRVWSRRSIISMRRRVRVTGKDVPMPYAANLEKLALPNVDEVVAGGEGRALPMGAALSGWTGGSSSGRDIDRQGKGLRRIRLSTPVSLQEPTCQSTS